MTRRLTHLTTVTLILIALLFGCSDDGSTDPDSAIPDAPVSDLVHLDRSPVEASATDQAPSPDTLATTSEQEPNNGATSTEYNAVQVPALVKGTIGTAGDMDLFGVTLQAGERLSMTLRSDGNLQPHLTIFDPAGKLPTALNPGPGAEVLVEYYALESAPLIIGVRDRRNIGSGSQNVGDPSFTYTLSLTPLTRPPISASIAGQHSSSLSPAGTVRVFAFTASASDDLTLQVLAKQLTPASDVDSRLSLFHPANKAWLGTNDDQTPGSGDSLIQGAVPFDGTYHAIVENESDVIGADLSFTLKIDKKP